MTQYLLGILCRCFGNPLVPFSTPSPSPGPGQHQEAGFWLGVLGSERGNRGLSIAVSSPGGAQLHEDRVQMPRAVGLLHPADLLEEDAPFP